MTGVLYSSLLELKNVLAIDDTSSDVDLERALETASRFIDRYCGRVFSLDTADTTHYYTVRDQDVLCVVDLVSVTSIAVDRDGDRTFGTTLATTDYALWPLNGPRYSEIRIWPTSSWALIAGRQVKVVGKYGCVEDYRAPSDVRQAALILASRYFKRSEAPFGILQSTDLGQYSRISAMDPDVKALLEDWRLTNSAWILV